MGNEFKLGAIGFVIVLIIVILFNSIITISSGFVGVKSVFGKIDPVELNPGIHIVNPISTSVEEINVKVKTINYKGVKDIKDNLKDGIMNKPSITILDNRGLPVNVELTVLYQLLPDKAAEVITKYGYSWDEKLVNPSVREVVRDIMGNYSAETIPEKRSEIGEKIKSTLIDKFKNKNIIITNVQLRNIKLPATVEQKILEVQQKKQEAAAQKYVLEKAKIEAETKKAQAKGEAEAKIEKAKGEAESIKLKAQAQAEANKKLSESITKELIEYEKTKKWNGVMPSTIVGDSSSGVLLNVK